MGSYGQDDSSFQAAGGEAGIARLVDAFYEAMVTLPEAAEVLAMHPPDLATSIEKLKVFLCGWLGGPRHYAERFGRITIPGAHAHLVIGEAQRDAWLLCMARAVEAQPWEADFAAYFLGAIAVPAEKVRLASQARWAPAEGPPR